MALEDLTGTKYIDSLVSTNPAAGDNVSEGDDHIRGIKNVLKTTFPSVNGAITATEEELNYVDGVTSAIQTQLDNPVAKGDGSSQDGFITLNCSQNSHGIKLKSPPHSAAASYTLTFPNDDGNANEYLQTNGSGVLSWNAVDLTSLSASNLTSGTVPAARITSSSIANDLIDSQHYADGSIDTAHIGDNQVTAAKIEDNITLPGNVTVSGDFTVSGNTTTVNTSTLAVEDPLISVATGNNSSDSVDIGLYGLYDTSGSQDLYGGLFRDASDSGKWKLFKDNQAAPTTTVDTSGTGYAVGTLVANLEGNLTAANSVDSDQYVDGSIDTAHIADAQITAAKLSSSMGDCSQKGFTAIGLDGGDYIGFNNNSSQSYFVNGGEEMRLEADGDLHVDGDVIAYSSTVSDEALKYDINIVDHALDKINQLKGVSYKYKHNDRESAGLLAQDVEKVMPSAVKSRKVPLVTGDDKEYKTLHYDSMTAILVEAIKELTAKVKKLENK